MNILITGGAGYIGSHTVRQLQNAGYNPIVLDNLVNGHEKVVKNILKVPLIIGNVGDKNLLDSILIGNHPSTNNKKIDGIIHFAAFAYVGESISEPLKYFKNNIVETLIILESIINHKKNFNRNIPIVFSSTCATYGLIRKLPITEDSEQNPINPYGQSKLIVEKFLNEFGKAYGLKSVILRYFNAAGADPKGDIGEDHDPETHLIPLIFDVISGKKKFLEIFGDDYETDDGTCIRDYIHVNDLADAHILSLEWLCKQKESKNFQPEIFNLGNGKGYSVKDIINSVELVTGLKVKTKLSDRRPGDPPILISSSSKAMEFLKWSPKYPNIDQIIKHAWLWYCNKNNFSI